MRAPASGPVPGARGAIRRLCVQWPTFGPYHLARLSAVDRRFAGHGVETVALETAEEDATYPWRSREPDTHTVRLFPGRSLQDLSAREISRRVVRVLDRIQPDAVAVNGYSQPDALAGLAWCRTHHRVAVVMSDSAYDDAPRGRLRELAKAVLIRQFDAALLAGTRHRAYFERLGFPSEAMFLGYDVVDNAYFRHEALHAREHPELHRHLPGLDSEVPLFLASARFVPRKNLEGLVRAYAAYRAGEAAPWRLVILGDGPGRASLEEILKEPGLDGVTLAGFRQLEELPAYYGLASAFIHPALADQWGLVVNEAMAAGLPVIVSSRAGCAADLVENGRNGFTFDPADPEELASLMRRCSSGTVDLGALGKRAQEAIARWSPARFAEALARCLEAGAVRAGRPYPLLPRLALWAVRHAPGGPRSLHVIRS